MEQGVVSKFGKAQRIERSLQWSGQSENEIVNTLCPRLSLVQSSPPKIVLTDAANCFHSRVRLASSALPDGVIT